MLQKTLIPLAFGQGIDTKRDKKQQVFGTLRKAENVVFETLNSARKRNGYDSISLNIAAQYLANFKDELLIFDSTKLYGYSAATNSTQERGAVYSVFPTTWPVANTGSNLSQVDFAVVNNLKIFAYKNESAGSIKYSVQDAISQTMLVSDMEVAAVGNSPRVAAIKQKIYVFYSNGNTIYFKTFNANALSTLSSATLAATNLDSTYPTFDVAALSDRIIYAYHSTNAGARLYVRYVTATDALSTAVQINSDPSRAIDILIDTSKNVIIGHADASAVKVVGLLPTLLATVVPISTIDSVSNIVKVAVCEKGLNSYDMYYSVSAANTYDYLTKKTGFTISPSVAIDTPQEFLRSVSLASKCFEVSGQHYLMVSYDSATQPTYFIVDDNGVVVAKISTGVAGGAVASRVLPHVVVSGSFAIMPSVYRSKFVAENGDFYSLNGVVNTILDFSNSDRFQNDELGNNMLIGGGVVQGYDGNAVVEHGFHVYPEKPTATIVTTGTPNNYATRSILSGTYSYTVVYRWTDQQGQEHRSAPSEEVQLTPTQFAAAGAGPYAVQLTAPTLRLTDKKNVIIEIYRTETDDVNFHLVNNVQVPFFNNPAADTVQFLDGKPDLDPSTNVPLLATGRALYTTGGVLENIAAPSAKIVMTHTASNRIFLAGLEQPNDFMYSKIAFPGQPVEFNDALRKSVDPIGGPITALSSMDDKLVIFKRDAIFFIQGIGPNNLGQQDSFTEPERISIDIGCLEPKSIVLTPDGLMFKSRKGIFLLSRTMGLDYIGAPIEEFNALQITSAKVVGQLNQVRFTTSDGDCLVYNYVFKFWATFTNHRAKSAETLGNDYYYLRYDGSLYKENRSSFSDAGSVIKMRLEIGWISFAGMQGFLRAYRMLVLGDWHSQHNLKVQIAYDFKEVYAQSAVINPDTAQMDATAYGVDSPYGLPAKLYGGYGNAYQARIDFKQQKCQSLKLLIEDVQTTPGQGCSLSQITFEVGGKTGLFKLGKGKKFAAS